MEEWQAAAFLFTQWTSDSGLTRKRRPPPHKERTVISPPVPDEAPALVFLDRVIEDGGRWTRGSFVLWLCHWSCFPGPNELDQVMGGGSSGARDTDGGEQSGSLEPLPVQSFHKSMFCDVAWRRWAPQSPCGNPERAFGGGLLPQDLFCTGDLLDVSLLAAGPKKASSSCLNPPDKRRFFLLHLAAEVGHISILQVFVAPRCCRVPSRV